MSIAKVANALEEPNLADSDYKADVPSYHL